MEEQETRVCTYHETSSGLHLGYLIFDTEIVKRHFTERELEFWQDWNVRGNA